MEKNKFGLTERDMATVSDIFRKAPEIKEVWIFGSRAKGNYKTGSDIDLAIINELANAKIISWLSSEISESSLPYKVDMVYLPDLNNKELSEHIKRVGILFYKS